MYLLSIRFCPTVPAVVNAEQFSESERGESAGGGGDSAITGQYGGQQRQSVHGGRQPADRVLGGRWVAADVELKTHQL